MFDKPRLAKKIILTKHAKERAIARAKLYLTKKEQDNIDLFLRSDFLKAKECRKTLMSPFYQNRDRSNKGFEHFTMDSELFRYMGKYSKEKDTAIIATVVFMKNL